jgi:hypothetical protein
MPLLFLFSFIIFEDYVRVAEGVIVCKIHFILSDKSNYVFHVYTQEQFSFSRLHVFISHTSDKLLRENDLTHSVRTNVLK